jgi:putative (di)nucleoside polyphosphate hydrolase
MPADPADLPYRPCVGVMLMNREGRLFVGERGDAPGAWQMPQGGIDAGESVEAAALRELWEETGVERHRVEVLAVTPGWLRYDLPAELVGRVWGGRFRGQKQKWVLMRFLGEDAEVRIDTKHPEFVAWRWLPPAEVLEAIVPFKRTVYAEVLAAFAGRLGAAPR